MDNKVYIVRCKSYDEVDDRMAALLDLMGGAAKFAKSGERIVLKVNLLRKAKPEEAVCTHPSVAAAVAAMVKREGAQAVIADSPGGGYQYSKKSLQKIYRFSGMDKAARRAGVELNLDTTARPVHHAEGVLTKHFDIITPVYEADAVFNLCKMKTHLFTMMTGAVKNIFGVIPGLLKPGYHSKLRNPQRFASMLLDLARYISPRISIMDAVVAMEGNGPGAGDPRPVGLLIGSRNPLALDVVAAEIMGIDRRLNPIILEAEQRDLQPNRIQDIDIVGVDLTDVKVADFKHPQLTPGDFGLDPMPWYQQLLQPHFKSAYTVRPRVIWDRCIACGTCIVGCPEEAIRLVDERAYIDDEKCIRCYCCHEVCPEEAIALHKSWLYQILNRN